MAAILLRRKSLNTAVVAAALGVLSIQISSDSLDFKSKKMIQLQGSVASKPKRSKPNLVRFNFRVLGANSSHEDIDTSSLNGKLLSCSAPELPWRNISGVKQGDQLSLVGNIRPNSASRNPFSYSSKLRREGVIGSCKVIFAKRQDSKGIGFSLYRPFLSKIISYSGLDPDRSLLVSMAFGFGDQISESIEREFKATGLSHLLVFSGAQVVMFFFAIKYLALMLRRLIYKIFHLFINSRCDDYLALVLSIAFVGLVGFGQTGLRALVALFLSVIGRLLESELSFGEILCITAFIMSVLYPGCIFEPSMQLTFAALFGIWAGLKANFRTVGVMILTSLSTSAISILWFGTFSIVGFVLNPLLVPAVSIISLLGGGLILLTINSSLAVRDYLLYPITWTLSYFEAIVHWASLFEWATLHLTGSKAYITSATFLIAVIVASFRPQLGVIRMGNYEQS